MGTEDYGNLVDVIIRHLGLGEYLVSFKLKYGNYKGNVIAYVEYDNIHILDSHEITSYHDMYTILDFIRYEVGIRLKFFYNRSIESWISEWQAHNILYELFIMRSCTGSVDLNEDESGLLLMLYKMISKFYKRSYVGIV